MPEAPGYAQLFLLSAVEKFGPCDHQTLFDDMCRENQWPHDFLTGYRLRDALIELREAKLIQLLPRVDLTDLGREVLAAARTATVRPRRHKRRWWRQ